jgi:hypothetical protein
MDFQSCAGLDSVKKRLQLCFGNLAVEMGL